MLTFYLHSRSSESKVWRTWTLRPWSEEVWSVTSYIVVHQRERGLLNIDTKVHSQKISKVSKICGGQIHSHTTYLHLVSRDLSRKEVDAYTRPPPPLLLFVRNRFFPRQTRLLKPYQLRVITLKAYLYRDLYRDSENVLNRNGRQVFPSCVLIRYSIGGYCIL